MRDPQPHVSTVHRLSGKLMATGFYYVYSLKDPRSSPAMPFYVGKGTGSRAFDHLVNPDATRKYKRIREIVADGHQPIVDILVDQLTEVDALRIEAELISAFGTEESGGPLTNAVVPSGLRRKDPSQLVISHGAVEQAQLGVGLVKTAIENLVKANPMGISNADTAKVLGLRSDYRGRQKDYLSYSILGLLLREGKIVRVEG